MVILGGVLEVIGFGVIVGQLVRVQRQEFGWPRFLVRSWGWTRAKVRRLLRRPRIVHAASVDMAGTSDVAGRLSVRRGMGPQAFDRFAAIEFNLERIESELLERIGEVDASVARLRDELTTTRSTFEQHRAEQEAQRKAELRSSIRWEATGVLFFLGGTVLSVFGSVTTC